ncbi:unnamed protein product [Allacma fusca]|uniref:CRAL-TRIO domain-containing protein n=1 Tax=Allacma fusca TaxID=39272 RepID=A0A8J2PS55_9HEXA|nr:unnamed protein product [Allacma fusca]
MQTFLQILVSCSFLILVSGEALTRLDSHDVVSNFIRDDVKAWEVPASLRDNYVYYWSGFDEEGRPLWILELGKWDIRKIVLSGNKTVSNFHKFVDKAIFNIINSMDLNSTEPDSPSQVAGLIDMDGFDYTQLASVPTVEFILKKFKYLVPVIYKFVSHGYIVNTNAYAEILIQLLRPILGSVMERVEIFGTNKLKWLPRLLKAFPRDQLPPWYGGDDTYKPIKAYGGGFAGMLPKTGNIYKWIPVSRDSFPVSAVEAGLYKGNKIFIGRAFYGRSLLPGRFSVPDRKVFIAGQDGEIGMFNYEILSAPPGSVKWVDYDSTISQIPLNAIEGGHAELFHEKLYIGRYQYAESTFVGCVQSSRRTLSVQVEGRNEEE